MINVKRLKMIKKFESVDKLIKDVEANYSWWDKFILSPKMNWLRYLIYNLSDVPRDCYNKVKWFIQRGKRGYSDRDCWDLDNYLSRVIYKSVIDLKNNKNSYLDENLSLEECDAILDKIIYAFHTAELISNGHYWYMSTSKTNFREYSDVKKHLKDSNIIIMSYADCKRYEEGWKLFQKYFNSLWN